MELGFCKVLLHDTPPVPQAGELHLRPRLASGHGQLELAKLALAYGADGFVRGEGPIERLVIQADPTLDDMLAAAFLERLLAPVALGKKLAGIILRAVFPDAARAGSPLPEGVRAFAEYAARAREGLKPGIVPIADSLAALYLAIRNGAIGNGAGEDLTQAPARERFIADWSLLAGRIFRAAEEGLNPFATPLFADDIDFARARLLLAEDRAVYRQQDVPAGERWKVCLPDGPRRAAGLVLRRPKSFLWKYWSREDPEAPGGEGYLFLAVYDQDNGWCFSTNPARRVPIPSLAEELQRAEAAGSAPGTFPGRWYDGKRHHRTLVGAPTTGSALSDSTVLRVVKEWARAVPVNTSDAATAAAHPVVAAPAAATLPAERPASSGAGRGPAGRAARTARSGRSGWSRRASLRAAAVLAARILVVFLSLPRLNPNPIPFSPPEQPGKGLQLIDAPPAPFDERRWAIVIGVNQYEDRDIPTLHYCVDDARLMAKCLERYCGIPRDHILLLTDEERNIERRPTLKNLKELIPEWLQQARPGNLVVVFFAGHGFLSKGQGFLATQDCKRSNVGLTGYSTAELRGSLNQCKASRKLLLLDCCHAGTERGDVPVGPSGAEVGAEFRNADGLITLASCQQNELSQEWDEEKHGLFTYFVAKGLAGEADYDRDGVVNSDELYRYVHEKVTLNGPRPQTPVRIESPGTHGVFELARAARPPAAAGRGQAARS
jgi:hypothetical protein